jgi:hypothetical protein
MITPTVCFYWGLLYLSSSKREDYALQCSSRDLYPEGKEAGKALVNLKEKLYVSVMASFLTMWQFWILRKARNISR